VSLDQQIITVGKTSSGILIQIPFDQKIFDELSLKDLGEFHAVLEYLLSKLRTDKRKNQFLNCLDTAFEVLSEFIRNSFTFDDINKSIGAENLSDRIRIGGLLANHSLLKGVETK